MLARLTAFLASPLGRALRTILSLALIVWLVLTIDWPAFTNLGETFSPALFIAALLAALAAYPLCALRWHRLLRAQHIPLSFRDAHRIVWIGQFYNAFLPGGIGGDAARLAHAFAAAPAAKPAIVTATLLDRLIGFAALLSSALLVTLAFNHLLDSANSPIAKLHPAFWIAAITATLALAALPFLPRFPAWLPSTWTSALHQATRNRPSLLAATALSMAIWILDFLSGWLIARSLGLDTSFLALSLALTLAYLSTLLPISLGGHGLREGTLIAVLTVLTAEHVCDNTLSIYAPLGFLFLVVTLLTSAFGGLALLLPAPEPLSRIT